MAQHNCFKCGAEVAPEAAFCPKCGQRSPGHPELAAAEKKRKTAIGAIIGAVALLAVIAAILMFARPKNVTSAPGIPSPPDAGVLNAPPPAVQPGGVVTAPPAAPSGGEVLAAPPAAPPAADQTPAGQPKPKPTDAMIDYLNHIAYIEKHRQAVLLPDTTKAFVLIQTGQAKALLSMMDVASDPDSSGQMADPLADFKVELNRQYANWLATLNYFDAKPAPPECRGLGGAFRQVIGKQTQGIYAIAYNLGQHNAADPNANIAGVVTAIKGISAVQPEIDQAVDYSNQWLDNIWATYDMPFAQFRIKKEQGNGSNLLGLP